VSRYRRHKTDLTAYPNVLRWYRNLAGRPAVQRGYRVPFDTGDVPLP
jgi:GST-like protein